MAGVNGVTRPDQPPKWAFQQQRAAEARVRAAGMAQQYRAGATLQEIGDDHGISRERVRQLIGLLGLTGKHGGVARRTEAKRRAAALCRDRKYLIRHGMTYADYFAIDADTRQKFRRQVISARSRGIEWRMTFAEWWTIWTASGKWEQRGRGSQGYVMARRGCTGPYKVGNVTIITGAQNLRENVRRESKHVRKPDSKRRKRP
jgi:hypothetical protein